MPPDLSPYTAILKRVVVDPKPLKPEDLYPIFAKELVHQELNTTDAWIEIPDEVRDLYKIWRQKMQKSIVIPSDNTYCMV